MFTKYVVLLWLVAAGISGITAKNVRSSNNQLIFSEHSSIDVDGESHGNGADAVPESHGLALKTHLNDAIRALDVMQSQFYELWIGTWPSAIDWTAAVTNTQVSAVLGSVARADSTNLHEKISSSEVIHHYFSHNIAYYFGENAFQIRNEAYDDMLWVVLGWLETIRFINDRNVTDPAWHGTQFVPAFAHRARVFYDIASRGWDTSLCSGGMIWNPRLTPYKNAITNQLFISASISMYLYFPGDSNYSPFYSDGSIEGSYPGESHDPKYLRSAVEAYAWLKNSNMTNELGLYVDGFHITGWRRDGSIGTGKCDERNEVVYTYNQGVVLSGLRGLWEGTGDSTYLEDGYALVRNVMAATGWFWSGSTDSSIKKTNSEWDGLGHDGILEEICDRRGYCSQDSQTFKGIFFQHLAQFCEALPRDAAVPNKTHGASRKLADCHRMNCLIFGTWVTHNADAALSTVDEDGKFGMWWGHQDGMNDTSLSVPEGAIDYRNNATVLVLSPWTMQTSPAFEKSRLRGEMPHGSSEEIRRHLYSEVPAPPSNDAESGDVNDRGRGRTVETQAGGLSVLRASWELQGL